MATQAELDALTAARVALTAKQRELDTAETATIDKLKSLNIPVPLDLTAHAAALADAETQANERGVIVAALGDAVAAEATKLGA